MKTFSSHVTVLFFFVVVGLISSSLFVVVVVVVNADASVDAPVPVIFDGDGNYDDTLALEYLVSNPLFDLQAVTLAGAGFATHHGYVRVNERGRFLCSSS